MRPKCLGYFAFEVSDLKNWETFGVHILGLQKGKSVEGESLALRLDDHESRLLFYKGDADDIVAAGWEFASEADLLTYVAKVKASGVVVEDGGGDLAIRRSVARVFTCSDPNGWAHEFYCGPKVVHSSTRFQSQLVRGGFECDSLGVGHFVTFTDSADRTNSFYQNILGFTVTDSAHDQGLSATFYHVETGRHHSVAVLGMPGAPKRIHHIMLQARALEDVGMAHDRFIEHGIPIVMSMGQHTNDRMVSFYGLTPSGFAVEFGWGGLVVDDTNWVVKTYSQGSLWGHKPAEVASAAR